MSDAAAASVNAGAELVREGIRFNMPPSRAGWPAKSRDPRGL